MEVASHDPALPAAVATFVNARSGPWAVTTGAARVVPSALFSRGAAPR
jgi:hypothetical protein